MEKGRGVFPGPFAIRLACPGRSSFAASARSDHLGWCHAPGAEGVRARRARGLSGRSSNGATICGEERAIYSPCGAACPQILLESEPDTTLEPASISKSCEGEYIAQ
jgi:hypothetical protein